MLRQCDLPNEAINRVPEVRSAGRRLLPRRCSSRQGPPSPLDSSGISVKCSRHLGLGSLGPTSPTTTRMDVQQALDALACAPFELLPQLSNVGWPFQLRVPCKELVVRPNRFKSLILCRRAVLKSGMLPLTSAKGKDDTRGPCSNFFVLATAQIQQRDMMLLRLLELTTRGCVAQATKTSSQNEMMRYETELARGVCNRCGPEPAFATEMPEATAVS